VPPEPSPSVSIAVSTVSIDLTAIQWRSQEKIGAWVSDKLRKKTRIATRYFDMGISYISTKPMKCIFLIL
jgi:hypothetical protein